MSVKMEEDIDLIALCVDYTLFNSTNLQNREHLVTTRLSFLGFNVTLFTLADSLRYKIL